MKKYVVTIIVAVVVGAIAFYGGMKYGETQTSAGGARQFAQNLERGAGRNGGGGPLAGGGFTSGEIISRDAQSITIKLRDGGSKIVFVSDSTQVMKSVQASSSDLVLGEQVTVTGSANSDGSLTAQSVQIRQEGAPKPTQ